MPITDNVDIELLNLSPGALTMHYDGIILHIGAVN